MRIILFLCLVLSSSLAIAQHNFVSSEKLYANPTNESGQLSPNGEYFSYIRREKRETFIELADLGGNIAYQVLKLSADMPLQNYQWVSEDVLQVTILLKGEPNTYLLTIEKVTKNGTTRIDGKTKQLKSGYIVDVLEDEPNVVMFSKYEVKRRQFNQTLYKITLEQLFTDNFDNAEFIEKADDGLFMYDFDNATDRLLAVFYDEDEESIQIKFKRLGAKNWKTALSFDNGQFDFSPVGFIDDNHLAVLTNKETDKIALYSFNIETKALDTLLYQHQEYDLTDATLSKTGDIESVEYVKSGLPKKIWLNKRSQKLSSRFEATFSDRVPRIIDRDIKTGRTIVYVAGPNEAGKYYLYEQNSDSLAMLVANYPDLSELTFPEHRVLSIKTEDDMSIEAYLTLPTDYSVNTLLVMPHGGPIGVRDYNFFEPNVQYLANRGFTILRVNFRGSEGYGKAFQKKGVGEFGKQIEADISAAVSEVLKTQQFENVCAIGSSYGAYSSVSLALHHPELYKCVVASYGIYDLPLLFNYSNFRSGDAFSKEVAKVVGENNDEKKLVSPVYLAESINTPTLIIAGKNDEVAGFEQSNRMRYVLEKLNKPVDSLFYNTAGHGHSNWFGDRHEYAYVVDFLRKTLGIPLPELKGLSDSSKQALAYDYKVLGDVFNTGSLTEKNNEKAFSFYQTASMYGSPEATFNLATYYQRGEQVEKDMQKALELYEQSAEMGQKSAFSRLASLYTGDFYIKRNDEKALKYRLKSLEDDQDNFNKNKHELAFFYCTASDEYRSAQKCLDEFRTQWKIIETDSDKDSFYSNLRDAVVFGNFTPEERASFTAFVVEALGIHHSEYVFELLEEGIYEYEESDRFSRSGDYVLTPEKSLSNAAAKVGKNNLYFGIRFTPDHPGFASYGEYTYAIFRWEKFDASGKLVDYSIRSSIDTAKGDWYSRFVEDDYADGNEYKLTVYDATGKVKYQKTFQ